MPYKPSRKQPSFSDLKAILSQTQLDNTTYQLLQTLIDRLIQFQSVTLDQIGDSAGSTNTNTKLEKHAPTHGYGGNDPLINVNSGFEIRGIDSLLSLLSDGSSTNSRRWRIRKLGIPGDTVLRFESMNDGNTVINSQPLALSQAGDAYIGNSIFEKGRPAPLGYWTNVPFSPSNFFATSPMVWTVGSAAVPENRYTRIGNTMIWHIYISWFSGSNVLSGTPSPTLNIKIPGGLTGIGNQSMAIDYNAEIAGTNLTAGLNSSTNGTNLVINKPNNANFALSDIPGMIFNITFEVG